MKRKISLVLLFSLSLALIGITGTRVPEVIKHHGKQQYRTVWASCEILASAAVSNAVVLGSFVRDRGTKRNKYRSHSVVDSMDRPSTRRPTMVTQAGSDDHLFRGIGCRLPTDLQDTGTPVPRPAPLALPAPPYSLESNAGEMSQRDSNVLASPPPLDLAQHTDGTHASDAPAHDIPFVALPTPATRRQVSFLDVGGLLEEQPSIGIPRSEELANSNPQDHARSSVRASKQFRRDLGGSPAPSSPRSTFMSALRNSSTPASDLVGKVDGEENGRRSTSEVPGAVQERDESPTVLQDVGELLQ